MKDAALRYSPEMAEAFQLASYPLCLYTLALLVFRKRLASFLFDHPYFLLVDLLVALGVLQLGGAWRSSYFAYTVTAIMMFTAIDGKRGAYVSALALTAVGMYFRGENWAFVLPF